MTTAEKTPNDVTIAAMQDARNISDPRFSDVQSLIGSLTNEQTVADAQANGHTLYLPTDGDIPKNLCDIYGKMFTHGCRICDVRGAEVGDPCSGAYDRAAYKANFISEELEFFKFFYQTMLDGGNALVQNKIADAARVMQGLCHAAANKAGWWTAKDGTPVQDNPYAFSNKLMLVVSECAEAMEGDRKGLKDDKLPHRDMREVELADAVIRIFDLAGAYGMDLGGAIAQKMAFNAIRPDHKPENRAAEGGKSY